jgi:NAD(P)-dependent dehydrogenase (short-subunit alcohol dehydrogenase family)
VTEESLVRSAVDAGVTPRRLDITVNGGGDDGSAGVATVEWTPEMLETILSTNFGGMFNSLRYEVTRMRDRGCGAIVTIASDAASRAPPGVPDR